MGRLTFFMVRSLQLDGHDMARDLDRDVAQCFAAEIIGEPGLAHVENVRQALIGGAIDGDFASASQNHRLVESQTQRRVGADIGGLGGGPKFRDDRFRATHIRDQNRQEQDGEKGDCDAAIHVHVIPGNWQP